MEKDVAQLIVDTLAYLKQEYEPLKTVWMTKEDTLYFYDLSHEKELSTSIEIAQSSTAKKTPFFSDFSQVKATNTLPKRPPLAMPATSQKPVAETEKKVLEQKITTENGEFRLELLPAPLRDPFNDIKAVLKQRMPHFRIVDTIPNDSAVRHRDSLRHNVAQISEVVILTLPSIDAEEQILLTSIARACDLFLAPTRLIAAHTVEQKKSWQELFAAPTLRLILMPDTLLQQLPLLKNYYTEDVQKAQRYLGNKPLLMLVNIALYLEQPSNKLALWLAIKQQFEEHTSHRDSC